ncbi:alkaline phosphatase family protein [Novosphingobium rosa]|uniref:alkaline phosphatase family protein n=1 Tax=Novosphingobium rosa TaxID=76978 RepID=UPI000836215B|nr:ectonucleotide pyrophosphatase/phosphodiesterase [Novosphingobium rosa]
MRLLPPLAALAACLALPLTASTALSSPAPHTARQERPPVTILISIDGFRADYLERGETPVLSGLAAGGVHAAMRPSFPSKTFPNHWALVTGRVPDHNGIVGNAMKDPARPDETFTMSNDDPFWWNEAAPIWEEAEKAGVRSATVFWPGSNVAWGGAKGDHKVSGGTRPEDWLQFNQAVSAGQRVNTVLDWMRRPAAIRPRLVTLYFDTVDSAGHEYGPDAPETNTAIKEVDRNIGDLVAGLKALGQTVNLVIVADHGMAGTAPDRVVWLKDIADPADFTTVETGTYAAIFPVPGHEAALEKALDRQHDHLQCWAKARIPARFRYGSNPRVAPWICLADVGWVVFDKPPHKVEGGNHGYDNAAPEMAALFVANGPAFRAAGKLPAFDNVDVAPLLRDLLKLPPAKDADGDDKPFRAVLKR